MTQPPLLEVKAGRILVLNSKAHICHKGLLLFTGSTFLSAFLTLIREDTCMYATD